MTKNQIDQIFANTLRVIMELNDEVEKLTIKFGTNSTLVQMKATQLATIIALHDGAQDLIYKYYDALTISMVTHKIKDAKILKYETGLSWEKINELTGLLIPSKTEQELDKRIRDHVKELNDLENDGEKKTA